MTLSTLIHREYLYEILHAPTHIVSIRRFTEKNTAGEEVDFDDLPSDLKWEILAQLQDEYSPQSSTED